MNIPARISDLLNMSILIIKISDQGIKTYQYLKTAFRTFFTTFFRIVEVSDLRSEEESTTPTSFGLEYKVNPFLRLSNHSIISTVGGNSPVEICANLREMKDNF